MIAAIFDFDGLVWWMLQADRGLFPYGMHVPAFCYAVICRDFLHHACFLKLFASGADFVLYPIIVFDNDQIDHQKPSEFWITLCVILGLTLRLTTLMQEFNS